MRFLKNIHTCKVQSINKWIDEFEQAKEPGDLSGAERVEEQTKNGDLVPVIMSKINYKDVPLDFRLKHYNNVVDILDSQTEIFCFCGRLATGLHTKCCKKFQNKINQIILKRYKDSLLINEDSKLLEDNKNV